MEINGTEVPEMLVGDFVLDENAPRETEHVIHFFTPECHESISPSIQRSMTGPRATKTGFICSSDVLYSRVVDDPLIDLTGAVVTSLHFTSQPDFCVCPIGGFEARLTNPEDVKLVILFGLVEWNERVRVRCLEKGFKTSFVQQLMSDQEDLLSRLKNVPVIGGDPTHEKLSISTRGYLVTGRKISVHTKLLENSQNAGQVFHDLHEEVEQATARFSRPKFIGFVFGAFGSLLRHKAHYMNCSAWGKLQNEFPYVQFIGFSSTSIYSGEYPFMADSRNKTSITVIVMERY